ncbi:hypothetical protein TL16_g00863 [Triparma laevis f. inornata]|uniref:Mitochondrial ribosomal protein L27 n=2 Tax=Triparma laevis TaxID=1534972 RepID=A0A9W7CHX3_9STRA|nr:hypothetical protein TL16_g00863 [Triparma laevis f. inornata]GMI04906.1 hypothetical protein TrLO_g15135 [Triparma laevis f. longispina]
MFRPTSSLLSKFISKSAAARLPLDAKRAGKGYTKHFNGTKQGRHTSKGTYVLEKHKMVEIKAPEEGWEDSFKLKPYVFTGVGKEETKPYDPNENV